MEAMSAEYAAQMFRIGPQSLLLEDNIRFTPQPYERTSVTWTDANDIGHWSGYHQERTMPRGEHDVTTSECIIRFDHASWPEENHLDASRKSPDAKKKRSGHESSPKKKSKRRIHPELLHALNQDIPFDMLLTDMEKHFVRRNF